MILDVIRTWTLTNKQAMISPLNTLESMTF